MCCLRVLTEKIKGCVRENGFIQEIFYAFASVYKEFFCSLFDLNGEKKLQFNLCKET